MDTQGMNKIHKVIKRVLRYEIGVFLKNSDFSYLYGSISYLFGYEKNRCFFLMDPGGCADTLVGRADPRASAVAVSPMWSGLVPFGGNRLLWQLVPS